jgi:hypothetical protein
LHFMYIFFFGAILTTKEKQELKRMICARD